MRKKIKRKEQIKGVLTRLKNKGKKIVFTNGCFDLLHIGHVRYLEEMKKYGDILIVAINSDRSVKLIKGEQRPFVPQEERAEVVSALECVDYVIIFHEPDPLELVTYLKPDVLVKGGDWSKDTIIGREVVEKNGGKVISLPLTKGASTSKIVQRIVKQSVMSVDHPQLYLAK